MFSRIVSGYTRNQYLNCRGDASPRRDLGVPLSRFERLMIRGKDLQIPLEYSTKFSDSER